MPIQFLAKLRLLISFCAVLAVVLIFPSNGQCEGVLVVRSAPVQVYDEAIGGLLESLSRPRAITGVKSIAAPQVRYLDISGPEAELDPTGRISILRPVVMVAVGAKALAAVAEIDLPIVSLMVADPDNITRGSAFITGVRMTVEADQLLSSIRTNLPSVTTIGIIYDPGKSAEQITSLQQATQKDSHLTITAKEVTQPKAVHDALAGFGKAVDAVLLLPDTTVITAENLEIFSLFSLAQKKPIIGFAPQYLKRGCAAAIYSTPEDMGRQAGQMVLRLLAGHTIGETPPEESQIVTIQFNRLVLKNLGFDIAPEDTGKKE